MGKLTKGGVPSSRKRQGKGSGAAGKRSRAVTTTTTTNNNKINNTNIIAGTLSAATTTTTTTRKIALPPPLSLRYPPSQSLVLDEDSGFGGDQSLDSDSLSSSSSSLSLSSSSLHSAPVSGVSAPGVVLPSLAMVPQAMVEGRLGFTCQSSIKVDLNGEEAQELPASHPSSSSTTTHSVPPLVSFRDVSLLPTIHQFKGTNSTAATPLLRMDGTVQTCGLGGGTAKSVRPGVPHNPPPLTAQLSSRSSTGSIELKLIAQPEEQHRARYQTEGSRGAVKDRPGTGHPTVKLVGYNKPTTVQIFVGSDTGKSGPHMFYQVCRVSGKNSTPCRERRVEGTMLIEASLNPDADMTMSCDCVGILKERNVDVEHRFKAVMSRGRKKSTKCRLVFRTFITLPNGAQETLQVVSQPIACTQPPGVPEICRKSLSSCSVTGGDEMFIFGKNFLKDTVVVFQQNSAKAQPIWEEKVLPDKDTLQPIHLIVTVPKYCDVTVTENVAVEVLVVSGGKKSEPQPLTYLPLPTKKEVQASEAWDEKPLPKGVSPCALQLNRHFAETGSLPQHLPEVAAAPPPPTGTSTQPPPSSTPATMSIAAGSASGPIVMSPVRTSRVMLSSAKKIVGRASRLASRSPRHSHILARTVRANSAVNPPPVPSHSLPSTAGSQKAGEVEVPLRVPGLQGAVSLESLVEMLKVVQKFPVESNLYTSVLQLVERLIQSMKNNISQQCKTEMEKEPEALPQPPSPKAVVHTPAPVGSFLLGKGQKMNPSLPFPTYTTQTTTYPPSNVAPMANPVSLIPLTMFSAMPSTVSAGPKVARVAPVAPVAPTTVVSSPGLTRTVRVCVAEAPHLDEPPLKKQREDLGILSDYTPLLPASHYPTDTLMASTAAPAMPIPASASPTFSAVNTLLPAKLVGQCATQEVLTEAESSMEVLRGQVRIPHSSEVLPEAAVHTTQPSMASTQAQGVFRPLPVLHRMTQAVPQQTQQQQQQQQQELHQLQQEQHHVQQQQGQGQVVSSSPTPAPTLEHQLTTVTSEALQPHTNQSPINVQQQQRSDMHVPAADPLLSQGPGLCVLAPSALTSAPPSQENIPSTSSAFTHSDPLLSQSSPVTTIHMEATAAPAIPVTTSEGTGRTVRSGDALMFSGASTQVSMQNEVTSAINLSETELLNYFDPNCFDNV